MLTLSLGLLIWTLVHLFPALFTSARQRIIDTRGENAYKGVFSLLILLSLVLMVYGWRHAIPGPVYQPEAAFRPISMILVFIGFLLMGAAQYPTRIRRVIRHPQLTGFLAWSVAHLMVNGDSRSVLVFGWLALWAVFEIILINRRDGSYQKPAAPGMTTEMIGLGVSVAVFMVFFFMHPYLSGVSLH